MKTLLSLAGCLTAALTLSLPAASSPGLQLEHKTLTSKSGQRIEAESGRLMVPENRANPRSRTIAIEFLRLRSRSASPRAPLFYLEGGPGAPGINDSRESLDYWGQFLEVCDVVLINQRGTHDSQSGWRW